MPIPHFEIKITKRSKGQSAVAGSAYQSGEPLFCEYDRHLKNYTQKKEVTYTEVLLPSHAPPEFMDREKLWNSVEANEKQWNAQLARRMILALPKEVSPELQVEMTRRFCEENFVSKGMCCDLAIHDKEDGNPHVHIMLTLRGLDDEGKWLPKSRKVYDLDENGERIRLPSGAWKSHKENTVDWNEQSHAENWRHSWEQIQNEYLEKAGSKERVDLRSFERQGVEKIPTVHMGASVTYMERKGVETNMGNLNREIKRTNALMRLLKQRISSLIKWVATLQDKRENVTQSSPSIALLLTQYMTIRQDERAGWHVVAKNKGTAKDLSEISRAIISLRQANIATVDDLSNALEDYSVRTSEASKKVRQLEARMKTIKSIEKSIASLEENAPIHDKYVRIGWKIAKDSFAQKHKGELSKWNTANRHLKKLGVNPKTDQPKLKAEYSQLEMDLAEAKASLEVIKVDMKPLKQVKYWIEQALEEPDGKRVSVREKLAEYKALQSEQERARSPMVADPQRATKPPTPAEPHTTKKTEER